MRFDVLHAYKAQKLTKMLSSKDGSMKRQKYFLGEKPVIPSFLEKRVKMVGNRQTQKKKCCLKKGEILSNIPFQSHW